MSAETGIFRSLEALREKARSLGVALPFSDNTAVLGEPLAFCGLTLPNRLGSAPMEGADSEDDGAPSELTARRYIRLAEGGFALLWFEAVSMTENGRSSARQLLLNEATLDAFRRLTEAVKEAGLKQNGFAPVLVLQANDSGRYSNPGNRPRPRIACRHPYLERFRRAEDADVVTDDELKGIERSFGDMALLAKRAGFDAVDIKACHGYLTAELLSAFDRPGAYGGSFENRTRLLYNGILAAKAHETPAFRVTARIGVYDGYPQGSGFGQAAPGDLAPDLTEPIRLIRELYGKLGVTGVNLTMGNPYVTTHVTRPFDGGKYDPPEPPLAGIGRMIGGIGALKRAAPQMTVLASAPSYLRQYADLYAAGAVEQGYCDGMLFGRLSFAQPDLAVKILGTGRLDPKRVCLTCGKCGDLIRSHLPTGCVLRDAGVYLPHYRRYLEEKDRLPANFRG